MIYKGYTYCFPRFLLPIWKRLFCNRGWHAWDEVSSINHSPYFFCDACGIETREEYTAHELDAAHNLLAVMHGDGGHHTSKVGFAQSCKDAEKVRHDLVMKLDKALFQLKKLKTPKKKVKSIKK